MTAPITPALTPAEWATVARWSGVTINADVGSAIYAFDHSVFIAHNEPEAIMLDDGEGLRRHALAALALHGHPAGFTRQDVADVEEMEMLLLTRVRLDAEGQAQADRYASLAARIAALLPPEGA